MTLYLYLIKQTLFPYAFNLLDACEVGTVLEGSKHKNRRGNLLKEATGKLNAWFVAYLLHLYLTDVVKQELIKQTNLNYNMLEL